jgi:hypothetical protein
MKSRRRSLFLIFGLLLAAPAPALAGYYDYTASIQGGDSTETPIAKISRLHVKVRNNGPVAGPNYDVFLRATKENGELVCEIGYSTQSPMPKGQERKPLAFQVSYPKTTTTRVPQLPGTKKRGDLPPGAMEVGPKIGPANVNYYLTVSITTEYLNDDNYPANNTETEKFGFPSGGHPSCQKLAGPNGQ